MPTIVIDGKKHTPGSNTLKKMKRKAAAEAAAKAATKDEAPKSKKKKKVKAPEKAPVPKSRDSRPKKKPVEGLRIPKGPQNHTRGGNGGEKKSTFLGVGPKAKLSTDKKSWKNKGNQMVRVMKYE